MEKEQGKSFVLKTYKRGSKGRDKFFTDLSKCFENSLLTTKARMGFYKYFNFCSFQSYFSFVFDDIQNEAKKLLTHDSEDFTQSGKELYFGLESLLAKIIHRMLQVI